MPNLASKLGPGLTQVIEPNRLDKSLNKSGAQEGTTTCQNTWSLARYRKVDSAKAAALFEFLSPLFYGYYSVVRGIVGPLFVYKVGLFFGNVDCRIPRWGWISWMVVIVVGIGVSMLWVLRLICMNRDPRR